MWEAFSWFVLNKCHDQSIQSAFLNIFTHVKTVLSNQRKSVCLHTTNLFTAVKVFGKDFSKLLAISCGLRSILSLNYTTWAISHIYKDLQCYENQKYVLERGMAVIPKQATM